MTDHDQTLNALADLVTHMRDDGYSILGQHCAAVVLDAILAGKVMIPEDCPQIAALRAERDEARNASSIYHEAWSETQNKLSATESALAAAEKNTAHAWATVDTYKGNLEAVTKELAAIKQAGKPTPVAVSEEDLKTIGKALDEDYWFIPTGDGDLFPVRCRIRSMTENPLSNVETLLGRLCERINRMVEAYEAARGAGGGWVACSERMPEKDATVLIWAPRCYGLEHADWNGKTWSTYRGEAKFGTAEVTHWRPLPPPPTDKAREEMKP